MKEEQDRKLEEKVRKYRLIVHNISPNDDYVKKMIAEELGENVEVVDWKEEGNVHYEGRVAGASCLLPQCDTSVMVRYKELRDDSDYESRLRELQKCADKMLEILHREKEPIPKRELWDEGGQ